MRKHNLSDLEHRVNVSKIYLTLFHLWTMYLCKFGEIHQLVWKIELRKGSFLLFLKDGDLESEVKVTQI